MKKQEYINVYVPENRNPIALILKNRFYEIILYSTLAFFIPFLMGHLAGFQNQVLVGSSVNFVLTLTAFYISGFGIVPIIILPSIGAYLTGIVFGPAS